MSHSLDLSDLPALLGPRHVALLVMFGSRARGDHGPQSDLDLGALRSDGRAMSLHELALLEEDLSRWSGLKAQLTDLARADTLLRFEMISDGRPLYAQAHYMWTDFVARTLIDHDDIAPFVAACVAGVGRAARAGDSV